LKITSMLFRRIRMELNEDEFWYLPVCPFFAIFWLFG
jgi:hypothetical protein